LFDLGVGNEYHAVGAGEHRPSGGVVLHLARNRVKLEGKTIIPNPPQVQRKKIEKQGAIGGGVEGIKLGPTLRIDHTVNVLQTGRLAAHGRSVVDDLDFDLAVLVVELDHAPPDDRRPTMNSTSRRTKPR
jgi:hypothetical protein